MKSAMTLAMILGAAGFAGTAKADSWNFFFSSGANSNASLGNSFTFTSGGGVNITASGFTDAGAAAPIFDKYTAPGYTNGLSETGLGLTNEVDHEINTSGYVELNLANIVNGTVVTLSMGSVQSGEDYSVYSTNTAGGKGPESGGVGFTTLGTNETINGANAATFSFTKTSSFQFIAVEETAANSGDVLLSTMSTAAPEPGYYVLLFVGMAALAAAAIRRQRRAGAAA